MQEILKNPSVKASLSKHGHDLSGDIKFTSSVGHLLPIYFDLLYPGDKAKFGFEIFSRTADISSPAMIKLTEHVDWFFVPMTQIYQFFDSLSFGISDYKTSFINKSTNPNANHPKNTFPLMPYKGLIDDIFPNQEASVEDDSYFGDLYHSNSTLKEILDPADEHGDDIFSTYQSDEYGIPAFYNRPRLAELLGYSTKWFYTHELDNTSQLNKVNPAALLAYHKIFYDHYRLTDRTLNNVDMYNVDKFFDQDLTVGQGRNLWKIHYRPWKRDYFTSQLPAPLINNGSIGMSPNSNLTEINNWLAEGNPSMFGEKSVNGSSLNTANIRTMFATEKLAEVTRRAGKHYDAQVLAHFGFAVPTGISGECYSLGSDIAQIQIDSVMATATTEFTTSTGSKQVTPLGDMAGKGVGYQTNKLKEFTAPCHGILMAIYSCVPECDYDGSLGIRRLNTYAKREDYFIPEYDRLGMQPSFKYESNFSGTPSDNATIVGWQYRYTESKLNYNKVFGGFHDGLRNWVAMRKVSDATNAQFYWLNAKNFYINPQFLDDIMNVGFQPAPTDHWRPYDRDPLRHFFHLNYYKSSVMSTYGLPQL